MNKAFVILIAIFGILGLTLLFGGCAAIGSYNSLTSKEQEVNQRWAQVENVYQRRYDLIPNLVNTVKEVANFEKETFTGIAEARASVGQLKIEASKAPETAQQLKEFQAAQGQLGTALSRLMAVSENYPQLKANQNFLDLQSQLEGTENRISVERRNFNLSVQTYNTTVKKFPTNLLAGLFGFETRPYFESDANAKNAPTVDFSK